MSRAKSVSILNAVSVHGVKDTRKAHLDESRVVVSNGGFQPETQADAIDTSSEDDDEEDEEEQEGEQQNGEDNDEEEDDVEATDEDEPEPGNAHKSKANNIHSPIDAKMAEEDDPTSNTEEPSFGEILASKHPHTISITDHIQPESFLLEASSSNTLALPSGMSLGTVLTQALRTNDRSLLESCLHTTDVNIIQNTIHRLPSPLAATLLSKLAERLSSRPGRYGHLITWIQYICIAHGGAIAGLPDVSTKLSTLYGVLTQQAKSLDGLLLLKGKLDMLDAQLSFRRQMQAQRGTKRGHAGEPGMIYIEGEKDNWDSDEDVDEATGVSKAPRKKAQRSLRDLQDLVDDEDDEDEEMPLVNGVSHASDDEEDDEESNDEGEQDGLVDVEAIEEAASSSESGVDVEDDDDEDLEEDEDEDSEMDSFIDDGSISENADDNDAVLDEVPQQSESEVEPLPPKKKVKRH